MGAADRPPSACPFPGPPEGPEGRLARHQCKTVLLARAQGERQLQRERAASARGGRACCQRAPPPRGQTGGSARGR
eukprot:5033851-Alexandrium_andersonii.AAC.1